jgi:hypothetical protein
MIVMIVLGWALALPLCVVVGLLCTSKMLGRRARPTVANGATDMAAFARQFPTVLDSDPMVSADSVSRAVSSGY